MTAKQNMSEPLGPVSDSDDEKSDKKKDQTKKKKKHSLQNLKNLVVVGNCYLGTADEYD